MAQQQFFAEEINTRAFKAAAFTMDARSVWTGHAHRDWHLLHVEAGEFEEAGSRHGFHVRAGQYRLSPGGLGHEIEVGRRPVACRNLHIQDRRLAARLSRTLRHGHHVVDSTELATRTPTSAAAHADPLENELSLFALVADLASHLDGRRDQPRPTWLQLAHALVRESDARIDEIARQCRVSREHLARTFIIVYGCSPVAMRLTTAVQRAVIRLQASDEPLAEVALVAGFYDQGHMSNAIRRKLGVTPGHIRRAVRSHSSNLRSANLD